MSPVLHGFFMTTENIIISVSGGSIHETAVHAAIDKLRIRLLDESEKVCRRAMVTLGELLFYLCSVGSTGLVGTAVVTEEAADSAVDGVLRLLQPDADAVAQHYACKAIDNVLAKSGFWPKRFAIPASAEALLKVWKFCFLN